MGLGSGAKCIYTSKLLTQDQLLKILKNSRDKNVGASNNGNMIRRPENDVDANHIIRSILLSAYVSHQGNQSMKGTVVG
jgi:hypothetical protein